MSVSPAGTPFGSFRLLQKVGGDASTSLYAATASGGERVAVRILRDGRDRERFEAEAAALARLDHPVLPRLVATGHADGVPYLATAWVGGEPLARAWGQSCPQHKEVCRVVKTLAAGLNHAHERGVVHNALAPDVVLLDAGAPRLIGFDPLGGPDPTVDVLGLGRVLAVGLGPGSPPRLRAVLERCLEPERRFRAVSEVAAALEAAAAPKDGIPLSAVTELPERLRAILSAAWQLSAAHAESRVHGRLCPAALRLTDRGVVLDDEPQPAVPDMSSPQHLETLDPALGFLAPEATRPGPSDPARDVFGLGALLTWALTDCPPFAGKTPIQILTATARGQVDRPSQLRDGVPDALDALASRATRPDPEQRPSAGEFAGHLAEWLSEGR